MLASQCLALVTSIYIYISGGVAGACLSMSCISY